MVGKTLSHFRILARIGEGGMGVVYKAVDEKLQRVVALKVLPVERLTDEERRLRFVREARTAAAITHPNIAVVHEIDEADGVVFIAMELVEGKTLRSAIGGRPMPLREALRLGVEIAEGLAAAHQARVIHRDLKPDNIMVTPDGRVKILDFGLAKLLEERAPADPEEASRLATISDEMTQAGRVLGTASYMSPEQARGLPVDSRSDLFSFGIVLYEIVTGRAPFAGATSMDVMSAILQKEAPPPTQANAEAPAELDRIVGKCLEKEPGDRYQDSRDLVVDLRRLRRDTESQPLRRADTAAPVAVAGTVRGWSSGRRIGWSAAALVALGSAALALWRYLPHQEATRDLVQRQITANPPDNPVISGEISPDGRYVAYRDEAGFHVHRLATGETLPLRSFESHDVVVFDWLPDSTGFLVRTKESAANPSALWSIALLGGSPRRVLDEVVGFSLSPDGKHIAYTKDDLPREVWISGPSGETPRRMLTATEDERMLRLLAWSPNSLRLAYLRQQRGPAGFGGAVSVETADLGGGRPEKIQLPCPADEWNGTESGAWLPDGRFLYSCPEPAPNGGDVNLWSVPVDPVSGKASGPPRRLTNWVGAQAVEPSVSCDGMHLAVIKSDPQGDIYVADFDPGGRLARAPRRLTMDDRRDTNPHWTMDSRFIVFNSLRLGTPDIFRQALDASDAEPVVVAPGGQWLRAVTPDGDWVVYTDTSADSKRRWMRIPVAGGSPQLLSDDPDWFGITCSRSPEGFCVLRIAGEGDTVSLFALDPVMGPGASLGSANRTTELPATVRLIFARLSPDGKQEAAYGRGEQGEGRLFLLTLPRGGRREIPLEKGLAISTLTWSPEADALYASGEVPGGRNVIVRIDLKDGSTAPIGLEGKRRYYELTASPDGRHLAYSMVETRSRSNVWLLENF